MNISHSKIGASSLYRWSVCPGSVKLSEGIPTIESKYAIEGTIAHEFASDILIGKRSLEEIKDLAIHEPVTKYVDFVLSLQHDHTEVFIEHKFDLSHVHDGMYGTSDAVIYDRLDNKLFVVDYKHGAGIPVEAENNLQLQFYALGSMMDLKLPCSSVEMVIVQPRCKHDLGPIRSWEVPSLHFIDFCADLKMYAKRTEEENAPIVGGSHCRFCPANKICPSSVKPEKVIRNPDPKTQFNVVHDENDIM